MKFSIIIVNYKTKDLTANCINSVIEKFNNFDYEIIIIDNASSDGSLEEINKIFFEKIKIIKNDSNIGFGPANNKAAKIANGDYLFFLNSDTILESGDLGEIDGYFKKNKNVGIIGPQLILQNGKHQPYSNGSFPSLFNVLFQKFNKDCHNEISEADWVSGAALIIRKEIFLKLKGFDENFFMYFEDIDLCKLTKNLGYKVIYFPRFIVKHLLGQSQSNFYKRKNDYFISQDYFFKKHYGILAMIILKILRFPYRFIINIKHKCAE
jgi:GT2 family glycosyltransferase